MQSHRRFLAWLMLASFSLLASAAARAENWLTPSEKEFFAALGLDARIEGKTYRRKADYEALAEIGNRAPEPLRQRILAIAQAYPHLSLSPEEKKEFTALLQKAAEKMQEELRKTVGAALLNQDSQQRAVDATNAMLQNKDVREFWDKQTKWYVREVEARESLQKNLGLITADLERRNDRTRPATDLTVKLGVGERTLAVTGKVGSAPLTATIVQIVIHKAKANGALSALNLGSAGLLQGMGVDMLSGAGVAGAALTRAQEKSFDMPIVKTFGLPRLAPGVRLSIDVDEDLNDVIFFERVSLTAWSAEGKLAIETIPGLAELQKLREEVPREERFKDPGPRGVAKSSSAAPGAHPGAPSAGLSPLFGGNAPSGDKKLTPQQAKGQAQRDAISEQQALAALNQAKTALAKKQNDLARIYLNQAIALAPESRSAATARGLLKKLGP